MKFTNETKNQWQQNEEKMEAMCDKFFEALKKIDGYSGWESIVTQRMVKKLGDDSGLNGKPNFDSIIDSLDYNFGFRVIKCDSLAEQMKVEAFIEEMKENPYQLKLIA